MFTLLDEQRARRFWEEEIRQEGEKLGENRLCELINRLLEDGKTDEVLRVTSDEKYRQKLYRELMPDEKQPEQESEVVPASSQEIVDETLRICREQNVLSEYLSMLEREEANELWEKSIRQESEIIGENRLSELISQLMQAGKNDDVLRVTSDEEYRQEMYKEWNIQ